MNTAMKHSLQLKIRNIEGALVRALGLTERRGFRVLGVELDDQADGDQKRLYLTVQSERNIEMLRRQLEKLHDVFDVTVANDSLVVSVASAG